MADRQRAVLRALILVSHRTLQLRARRLRGTTTMRNVCLRALAWLGAFLIGLTTARVVGEDDFAFPAKAWEKCSPESQGVDPGGLAGAVKYLEEHAGPDGIKRLVIVRRGRMIWSGSEADRRQPV